MLTNAGEVTLDLNLSQNQHHPNTLMTLCWHQCHIVNPFLQRKINCCFIYLSFVNIFGMACNQDNTRQHDTIPFVNLYRVPARNKQTRSVVYSKAADNYG